MNILLINDREPIDHLWLTGLEHNEHRFQTVQSNGQPIDLVEVFGQHSGTEVLVTTYQNLSAATLALLPKLRHIVATTTAVEYIDHRYCETNGIEVHNTSGYGSRSIAEFALSNMMALNKHLIELDSRTRKGDLQQFDLIGAELAGKTAGVLGFGTIGQNIAQLVEGIGMTMVHHQRTPKPEHTATWRPLEELLQQSDALFIAVPLTEQTRNLIDAQALSLMKTSSIIVNISPGEIVEETELVKALKSNRLKGAALDLLTPTEAFNDIDNTILSFRRAWYTEESFRRRTQQWVQTVLSLETGKP